MKVYLLIDGRKTRCNVPFEGADHVLPHGIAACPKCKAAPFKAVGGVPEPSADDRSYEATAYCAACRAPVGTMRVEMNTLFGVREDEAVLVHGRCRVY